MTDTILTSLILLKECATQKVMLIHTFFEVNFRIS